MASTGRDRHQGSIQGDYMFALNEMKVSIVAVSFNSAATIEDTIRSVRDQ
jgi:hypothetical protein